jgi:hypothetical protein
MIDGEENSVVHLSQMGKCPKNTKKKFFEMPKIW